MQQKCQIQRAMMHIGREYSENILRKLIYSKTVFAEQKCFVFTFVVYEISKMTDIVIENSGFMNDF